jgi:RHS repeat-associated protein
MIRRPVTYAADGRRRPMRRRAGALRAVGVGVATAMLTALAPATAQAATVPGAQLYWSAAEDRSSEQILNGAALSGNVAIYVNKAPSVGFAEVKFYLDDVLYSTDTDFPFDFNGTQGCLGSINPCPNGKAVLFDTTSLRQGSHQIRAEAKLPFNVQPVAVVWGSFTVAWPEGVIPRVYPDDIPNGIRTSIKDATSFLYTGAHPAQTGVAAGAIDEQRAAVIHGTVTNGSGTALTGVKVTIDGHPEYGLTYSRADGAYDLAVNGGSALTVNLSKAGLISAQRTLTPSWQDWSVAPAASLLAYDANSTAITPGSLPAGTLGVARGSVMTDAAGSRRSTLLFPAGTTAQLVMPDGSRQATSTLTVQQTEFTVGSGGHQAMPAPLPPSSAYTYAVDMSITEMRNNGAIGVEFSAPVWHYNENFLNFPVGADVPAGYYDYQQHAWVPADNGRVVKILSITAGEANVDLDGSGRAATTAAYAAIGMTDGERGQLASLYTAGASLWRVGMKHFCPWDMNWPFHLPAHAKDPWWKGLKDLAKAAFSNCFGSGSVIGCEDQSLGEQIPLTGSGTGLTYESSRVPDSHRSAIDVEVVPDPVPDGLLRVTVEAKIAGRSFLQPFNSPTAGQRYTFEWDGKDAFGRQLNGTQPVTFQLNYVYQGQYGSTTDGSSKFGDACNPNCTLNIVSADPSRAEITLGREIKGSMHASVVADARGEGLGGWLLGMHHVLDPQSQTLGLGDGSTVKLAPFGSSVLNLAGNGTAAATGDGGAATSAALNYPGGVAYDPTGNLYIADTFNDRIRKVTPGGVITTIAGTGTAGYGGDGGPATSAQLHSPLELTVAPDGAVIFADVDNHRIRRIAPDGVISTVAGSGTDASSGDGGAATSAGLREPVSVALSTDGSLFIADYAAHRIRRVSPDGLISTWAGTGIAGFSGDTALAKAAQLNKPSSLALDGQGTLYVADSANHRIRKITADGVITTVAGSGVAGSTGDGGSATAARLDRPVAVCLNSDGELYIGDQDGQRIRRLNTDDSITTIAGTGAIGYTGGITAALGTPFALPRSLAMSPDGSLTVADAANNRVRKVTAKPLGIVAGEYLVPSQDRSQVYVFDTDGRHARTVDALTGVTVFTFAYEPDGRLRQVTDHGENQITITHPDSTHVQIQAPDNNITTLTLNSNGWATAVTDPAGLSYGASYTTGGLLTSFTDRRQHASAYTYDSLGLLKTAKGRDNKITTLTATPLDSSEPETVDGTPVVGDGFKVVLATPMGRSTTHRVTFDSNDVMRRYVTDPTGETQTQIVRPDGVSIAVTGGTTLTSAVTPDPRWGMVSPQPEHTTLQAPGRNAITTTTTQAITLNGGNPLDVATQTITQQQGSRTWTTAWAKNINGSTLGTLTATSPLGRTQVTIINSDGRVSRTQTGDLTPIDFSYDPRGRPTTTTQGSGATQRQTITTYDAHGFPATVQNPLLQTTTYSNDALGRPYQVSGPAGTASTSYDDNDNLKTIAPPGRTDYTIGYEDDNRPKSYKLPDTDGISTNDTSTYTLNDDRQYKGLTLPGGDSLEFGYDATSARPTYIERGSDQVTFGYGSDGFLANTTSADGVIATLGYTSTLPISTTWSGAGISGSVSGVVDDQMRVTSQSVNGANNITFGYDTDGALATAGAVTLTHSASTGLLDSYTVGTDSSTTIGRNGFGEPTSFATTQGGSAVHSIALTARDAAGRITSRSETIGGVTTSDVIGYTPQNQLDTITRAATVVSDFDYDAAGNLTSETHGASTVLSTYDAQDRILTRGTLTYAHNADGERTSVTNASTSTTTTYGWKMGRLSTVTMPGTSIAYLYDANGNRVGKKVNGTLTRIYLWAGGQLVAEANGSGTILNRFVYATRSNTPDYLLSGGVIYRLVTDERGSVRLVINQSTGAVTQRLDYDEWGRVTTDTNPGFQPLGYAGGLYETTTGLVHSGARDYDPLSTRWLSRDTIGFGGGANQYAYVGGDPINQIDPTGHSAAGCLADILAVASMIPGVGPVFAVAYSAVQLARGHLGEALLGLAAVAIPLAVLGGVARAGRFAAEAGGGRNLLSEARAARNTLGESMRGLERYTERPAVFVGAYDEATGEVNAFHSVIGGAHAEEAARAAMPNARLTEPMGWRQPPGATSEQWQVIPVCAARCQPQFPSSLFPAGTPGQPGGVWDS